jgi:hypothetical protein
LKRFEAVLKLFVFGCFLFYYRAIVTPCGSDLVDASELCRGGGGADALHYRRLHTKVEQQQACKKARLSF